MHPSAALFIWSCVVLSLQALAYPGLLLIAAVVALQPGVVRPWLAFVRRARWLLLSLWLILAYHTPGEAYADLAWAPTYEGIADASVHALRLVVMLGCLSWLFARLGRDGLLAGLWGLLLPATRFGVDGERLVVRLALVLEGLEQAPEKGAWKKVLSATPSFEGPSLLTLHTHAWHRRDGVAVLLALLAAMAVMAW